MCSLKCCGVLVALVAVLVGTGHHFAQQPKYAEMAIRKIVEVADIPNTVFDHIKVLDDSVWFDILTKGNLGMAEGYMHGKLDLDPLPLFVVMLNGTSLGTRRKDKTDYLGAIYNAMTTSGMAGLFFNMQSRELSTRVTKEHYDAGNDLYEVMLGPSMSYTCAYWKDAKNLDEAQEAKFNLIFRKLELRPGMKVADLGMGWGTAAAYMHKQGQDLDITGVSLSEQQVKWAQANLAKPGLQFVWSDYRDHCDDPTKIGTYDRIYSIGMMEHIGWKNYDPFFKCIKALLKPDGLAIIHTIGEPDFVAASDPFLDKYIFPGAVIPTLSMASSAFENYFILEDFQNFGHDYSKTLAAWNENSHKFFKDNPDAYKPEFQRMWHYYLKMCEALFELRINQLWHFVLSPRPAMRERIDRQL